jgi:mRNA interferase RelE/StbE
MCDVSFTPGARNDLKALDVGVAQRIIHKIRWLAENCESIMHEPLSGSLREYLKLRVGDYRVLYTYDRRKKHIVVHIIDHRRRIYRMP